MHPDPRRPRPDPERLSDLAESITGMLSVTEAPAVREYTLRERIDSALQASMDRCARCKACDQQVDAVMAVIAEELAIIADENVVRLLVEVPDVGTAGLHVRDLTDEGRSAADRS